MSVSPGCGLGEGGRHGPLNIGQFLLQFCLGGAIVTGEVFFESSLCQFAGGFEGVPDVEVSRE